MQLQVLLILLPKEPTENLFEVASNLAVINGESSDKAVTLNGTVVTDDYNAGLSVFGMYRDRSPFDKNGDGFTEITKVENKTFGLKSFLKPTSNSKLSLDFHTTHEFRRGGNNLELLPHESDITEQITSDVVGGGLTYEGFTESRKLKYSVYGTAQLSKNDNFYGGKGETLEESLQGYGNTEDETYVLGGQVSYNQDNFLGNTGVLTVGSEYKNSTMSDSKPGYNAFINQELNIYGIYLQEEWQATKDLKVLGGIRADIHNIAEESVVFNPRLNILYSVSDNLQLRTSYAKGFRLLRFSPKIFTLELLPEK